MSKISTPLLCLFHAMEVVLGVKIYTDSFASFELICSEICQLDLSIATLGISRDLMVYYSRRKAVFKEKINKTLNKNSLVNFDGGKYYIKDLNQRFVDLITNNKIDFISILKDENIRNHVFQYHSLKHNDVWCFDFTTLETLKVCSKAELLIVLDLTSRKVVAWKLYQSKQDTSAKHLITVFEEGIETYGKPNCLHSDADWKNHSSEFLQWCESKNIVMSITKDMFGKNIPVHGNQVSERFNRTFKHYMNKVDESKRFLYMEFDKLEPMVSKTIEFYNDKAHTSLGVSKTVTPNQSFFDNAIYDALKESWEIFKQNKGDMKELVNIDYQDKEQITSLVIQNPEFVKIMEKAEPSKPKTIHVVFNQYLTFMAPIIYNNRDAIVKQYFDEEIPSRVKGPGRENKPSELYKQLKRFRSKIAWSVVDIMRLFSMVMSAVIQAQIKLQTKVILEDRKKNKEEIIQTLKNEIVENRLKRDEKIDEMQKTISYLESIQKEAENQKLQLQAMKEKRKNRVKKPLRSPAELTDFLLALRVLEERKKEDSALQRFNSSRDKVAMYALYFSGFRVSNILLFSLQDMENLFYHSDKRRPGLPLIKKGRKVEVQEVFIGKAVSNQFVFGEYNLMEDFNHVKSVILKKNNELDNPLSLDKLSFYASYKTPLKKTRRIALTNNVNEVLAEVKKRSEGVSKTKILSSHRFRINYLTTLIVHYGYPFAQKYAHHTSMGTTALYDRSIVDFKKLKSISSVLAETRRGKRAKAKQKDQILQRNENQYKFLEQANELA